MIDCIFSENRPLEGDTEAVTVVPAVMLKVISDGFLASSHAFSKGPLHFPKAHALRYKHREHFGMIGCIFTENGPLQISLESSLNGTVQCAKGDFHTFFTCIRAFSNLEPITFPKAHILNYMHGKMRNDRIHIRGEFTYRK